MSRTPEVIEQNEAKAMDQLFPGKGLGGQYLAYVATTPSYSAIWLGMFGQSHGITAADQNKIFAAASPTGHGLGSLLPAKGEVGHTAITNPLQAIGDFFSKLGQPNLWIRVGEVILGIALIGIGLAHLTGTDNLVSKAMGAVPAGRVGKALL
jgi:hypothetical protein